MASNHTFRFAGNLKSQHDSENQPPPSSGVFALGAKQSGSTLKSAGQTRKRKRRGIEAEAPKIPSNRQRLAGSPLSTDLAPHFTTSRFRVSTVNKSIVGCDSKDQWTAQSNSLQSEVDDARAPINSPLRMIDAENILLSPAQIRVSSCSGSSNVSMFPLTPTPVLSGFPGIWNDPLTTPSDGRHDTNIHIPLNTESAAYPTPCFSSPESIIPRTRSKRLDDVGHVAAALNSLGGQISFTRLIQTVLDPNHTELDQYRGHFFEDSNKGNICALLDTIFEHHRGHRVLQEWMLPHAVSIVTQRVSKEMESAKPHLRMQTEDVTAEFIEKWDINAIMNPIAATITPTWSAVLVAATETSRSQGSQDTDPEAQIRETRNRSTTRNVISAQVHYTRSLASCKAQIFLGLYSWTISGCRKLVDMLHEMGLSMSFPSISEIIDELANSSISSGKEIAKGPHMCNYDNINFSMSNFVEQTADTPSKVKSGSFPLIYKLLNARPEDMKLAPIMERLKNSVPMKASDLRPSKDSMNSFIHQTTVNVAKILFKHVESPKELVSDPLLQDRPIRPLPKGHKTEFVTLRASTIEEASVKGNLLVHEDIYERQLGMDSETLSQNAIPSVNDQLTNARIRGARAMRVGDTNPWNRRDIFQLGIALFHLVMNFIWALRNNHMATISQYGSLAHLFLVIDKTRLGGEKPDYHTLLSALTQILEGLILNAWRDECGSASLDEFVKSANAKTVIETARKIVENYAVPDEKQAPIEQRTRTNKTSDPAASTSKSKGKKSEVASDPEADIIHQNVTLLIRDLLYVIELVNAISAGDFGRVEAILPDLANMFRGAGSNNYSTEILHLLFNLKQVWTPEFANVMRDNMIINISGLEGHAMAADLNIEHCIGYLKAIFAAKGIYSNWDRLGEISAAVKSLQEVKKRGPRSLKTAYQGTTHTQPNTSALVWRIADKAAELKLQKRIPGRSGKPILNIKAFGRQKMVSSSLATFNKKMEAIRLGLPGGDVGEEDDIPALPATFSEVENSITSTQTTNA